MKKPMLSVIALGVLGGLFLAENSWSQQPATGTSATSRPAAGQSALEGSFGGFPGSSGAGLGGLGGFGRPRSEIEQLMTQLREADDAEKKADLTKKLEAAIVTNFDEDMTSRETELTKLEARLTKLRAQLDRRRKAKPEIIQLQLKVMVNEADGLGFSGASVFDFEPSSTPGNTGGFSEELLLPLSRRR